MLIEVEIIFQSFSVKNSFFFLWLLLYIMFNKGLRLPEDFLKQKWTNNMLAILNLPGKTL